MQVAAKGMEGGSAAPAESHPAADRRGRGSVGESAVFLSPGEVVSAS